MITMLSLQCNMHLCKFDMFLISEHLVWALFSKSLTTPLRGLLDYISDVYMGFFTTNTSYATSLVLLQICFQLCL